MKETAESEVDWNYTDQQKLIEAVRKRGFSDESIKRIIATEATPQEALRLLTDLSKPLVNLPEGAKLPDPSTFPPRELDAHEEAIYLEMLAGEHEPVYE